jgi:hypothetical protein
LWVFDGVDIAIRMCVPLLAHEGVDVLAGSASPDGAADFASAMQIAVKPCACGAPLRGCGLPTNSQGKK